jgi:hypothetical protein
MTARFTGVNLLDGQLRQQSQSPFAGLEHAVRRASDPLALGEIAVLLEVEAVFAREVRQ